MKVDNYITIFDQLKQKLKWKFIDDQVLMMVAATYVVNNKPFDVNRFMNLSDFIKNNVGMFSTLKSHPRYATAAMLDVRYDNPERKFAEMMDIYDLFIEHRFHRGSFTYIAALVLLANQAENRIATVEKSLSVYKAMKKEHGILTSSSDYPLVAMLATKAGEVSEIIETVEMYYRKLHQRGFRKGNDLQFLSHILSMDATTNLDQLVENCDSIVQVFSSHGIKPKTQYYSVIGMLALVQDLEQEVAVVQQIAEQLNAKKQFKWKKDTNLMIAVLFVISTKTEDYHLLETQMHTTLETILQAQQATLIATMAGATAASTSSSS